MAMAMQMMSGAQSDLEDARLQTRHTRLGRMSLRNFRGHGTLDLDLGRITALIGPTGSGKTTALQALFVIKAALEKGHAAGGGGSLDSGDFGGMAADGDSPRNMRIGVEGQRVIGMDGAPGVASSFSYGAEFGRSGRPSRVDAAVEMWRGAAASGPCETRVAYAYDGQRGSATVTGPWVPAGRAEQAQEDGGFAPRIRLPPGNRPAAGALADSLASGEYFATLLAGAYYVPFSRAVDLYASPLERGLGLPPVGRAGGASSPLGWIVENAPLRNKVSSLLEDIGLGRVAARALPPAGGEGRGLPPDFAGAGSPGAAVRRGDGSASLITMLAVLAGSPRGSVIAIEEPEMHLDPESQTRLAGAMVRLSVEEGKQIIFTCHSSHILYPLLGYVRKEGCPITNADLVINSFGTGEAGVVAGAERLDINERGQVGGGLRGFWAANMKALDDLLG